jgi:hypothetical protein
MNLEARIFDVDAAKRSRRPALTKRVDVSNKLLLTMNATKTLNL